MLKATCLTTIS